MTRHGPSIRLSYLLALLLTVGIASCGDGVGNDPIGPSGSAEALYSADSDGQMLDADGATFAPYSDDSCCIECIVPGEGPYFPVSESATSRQGRNTKLVSYSAYNTEDRFLVNVTYEVTSGRSNAHATITIRIDGDEATFEDVPPGSTVQHSVALPADWEACDEVSYTIRQEGLGRPVDFSGSYALIPVCPMIEPVLWNRLGSEEEVQSSEIGPGGTIVGTVNFDHEVQFGKGITPNTGGAGSGVDFPTTVADPERGCVELWAQFYDVPRAYSHGVYGFVNASHWSHNVLSFDWYNGADKGDTGRLQFVLKFNSEGPSVNYRPFDPAMNQPVHLAVVWDRYGIDGTGDYMRIYVDGVLAASGTESNDWGASNTDGSFRVATAWDRNFATDRFTVDNIKV